MNLGRVLWPRLGSILRRLSTCQTRVLSNTGVHRRTERSSCNQSYCSAILTRYVSCVYCRGKGGILSRQRGWTRARKGGGRKERSLFFFFFWKDSFFLKRRKGRRREWLRRGDKEKSNRKRDDRETGEESYDWFQRFFRVTNRKIRIKSCWGLSFDSLFFFFFLFEKERERKEEIGCTYTHTHVRA